MSSDPFEGLSDEARTVLRKRKVPDWTQPMLARLTHDHFSDPDWIFERKLDGERVLAFRNGSSARLMSRNKKELNDTYPEIVEALEEESESRFVLDGEVVAFEGDVTSFERLQNRMKITDPDEARASDVAVYYYVFDVLHLADYDTTEVTLRDRKRLLRGALDLDSSRIRLTSHRNEEGLEYYEEACRSGWEGIIAKDATSTYVHSRSSRWLKFKCSNQQEFVIVGFTDPKGSRVGFGALLIGYFDDDGDLRYAGKVGTGYDDETLRTLRERMDDLERPEPPFVDEKLPHKGVHWLKPKLVGEFGYTELTRENRLRHPRFLGLRRDKSPTKVRLER